MVDLPFPRKRERSQYFCVGESRTKQSHKDECDINNVMRRFEKTGVLEHTAKYEPQWGDFVNTPSSFQEAMHQVQEAERMFMDLPAKLRKRFDNDPGQFIDFVENADIKELRDLGLAKPERPDRQAEGSPRAEAPQEAKAGGKPAQTPSERSDGQPGAS